jgi:hypothetical protein
MTFVEVKPRFYCLHDVGRHFEDESNKRNSLLTNPTANVVGLQESQPMVTTFGKLWYLWFTNGSKTYQQ